MSTRNELLNSPPYPVDQAAKTLGANLRVARLRRNLSILQVAQKIGTGPRVVTDAEKGKASTGVAVYIALLWVYDVLSPFSALADPANDDEGLARLRAAGRQRARRSDELDNDF